MKWQTCDQLKKGGWCFAKECLSYLQSDAGRSIIRAKKDGSEFAVMALGGPIKNGQPTLKIVKTFTSLDAARAYHFAMHRN